MPAAVPREVNEGACPAHLIFEQMGFLKDRFPGRFTSEGLPDWELPLFPTAGGTVVGKEAMTRTIEFSATALGVELAAPDGSERASGHSLRVTGAQGLLAYGLGLGAYPQVLAGVSAAVPSVSPIRTVFFREFGYAGFGFADCRCPEPPLDVCSGVGGRTHAGGPGRSGCGGGCGSFATALI